MVAAGRTRWPADGQRRLGARLIDYYLGMGPMILGHVPVEVIAAEGDIDALPWNDLDALRNRLAAAPAIPQETLS
jgi:hypothetical protein